MADLDPYVFCPYDRNHYLPQSRLQAHIVKCEQKYPPLQICPYNATHRVKKEDFKDHLMNCEFKITNNVDRKKVIVPTTTIPKVSTSLSIDDEDWDN